MSSPAATLTFVLAETVFAVLPVLRFGLPDGVLARFALVLAPLFWFLGMRYRRHGVLLVATPVAWFVGMTPHLTAVSSLSELLLAMMALLSYLVVYCHQSGERSVYGAHARDEPRAVTTTWAPMAPVFSGEGTAGLYPVVLVLVSFALSPIYAMDWLLTGDAYRVWQTQLARVQSAIILVFALQSAFILEQLLKRRTSLAMSAVRVGGSPRRSGERARGAQRKQIKAFRGWAGLSLLMLSMPLNFGAFNRVFDGRYFYSLALILACIGVLALGTKLLNDYALAAVRPRSKEEE